MSSINSNIAASVSQGAIQSSQVSRVQDAVSNEAAAKARELRKKQEAHTESVEDSYQANDQQMSINPDEEQSKQQQSDSGSEQTDEQYPPDYRPIDLKG